MFNCAVLRGLSEQKDSDSDKRIKKSEEGRW